MLFIVWCSGNTPDLKSGNVGSTPTMIPNIGRKEMNLDSIIGKPLSEVKRLLVLHDMSYRISTSDGIPQTLTCDYDPSRVNLKVENNLIKSYFVG